MKFFVKLNERKCLDPQEYAAMLKHRLSSLKYQITLLNEDHLIYAFRNSFGNIGYLMFEVDSLEKLDYMLKRDPQFPFVEFEVIPVISTKALVIEAQDYLGEKILDDFEMDNLEYSKKKIQLDKSYWLAIKVVRPYSPLLSKEERDDIDRRTLLAQKAHFNDLEFADDNPVGKPIGILIAQHDLDHVKNHVETCEVFPDTDVQYIELKQLEYCVEDINKELKRMYRLK